MGRGDGKNGDSSRGEGGPNRAKNVWNDSTSISKEDRPDKTDDHALPALGSKKEGEKVQFFKNRKTIVKQSELSESSAVHLSRDFGVDTGLPEPATPRRKNDEDKQPPKLWAPLIKKLKNACRKPPGERSACHVNTIQEFVTTHCRLFRGSSTDVKRVLCGLLVLEEFEKGQVIFYQGTDTHDTSKYYILLDGRVAVYVARPEDIAKGKLSLQHLGTNVKTLNRGSCFGELALFNSSPRGASVVCRTACSVLTLEKADFIEHMLGPFQAEMKLRVNFLTRNTCFNGVSHEDIMALVFYMQEGTFPAGQVFTKEDRKMRFVMQGEGKLMAFSNDKMSPTRGDVPLMPIQAGHFLGEENLFDAMSYQACYFMAQTNIRVLSMNALDFEIYSSDKLLENMKREIEFRISYLAGRRSGMKKNMQELFNRRPSLYNYVHRRKPSQLLGTKSHIDNLSKHAEAGVHHRGSPERLPPLKALEEGEDDSEETVSHSTHHSKDGSTTTSSKTVVKVVKPPKTKKAFQKPAKQSVIFNRDFKCSPSPYLRTKGSAQSQLQALQNPGQPLPEIKKGPNKKTTPSDFDLFAGLR